VSSGLSGHWHGQCRPGVWIDVRLRIRSEQEAERRSISVSTDLYSPHSPMLTHLWAWAANNSRTIEAFATAWCSMEQEYGARLGRGRALSVSRFQFE
jgi:hypothetical protein